jgi:hypothetical protein
MEAAQVLAARMAEPGASLWRRIRVEAACAPAIGLLMIVLMRLLH